MYNLWYFLTIVLAIVGMFFAIKAVMFVPAWWHREISKLKFLITVVLFGVFTIAACLAQAQTYVELKHMADTEYAIYLDGQEVDADKVAFWQYSISVDEENKEIFLSQKKQSGIRYIPIIR